jgi:hypothetical protein
MLANLPTNPPRARDRRRTEPTCPARDADIMAGSQSTTPSTAGAPKRDGQPGSPSAPPPSAVAGREPGRARRRESIVVPLIEHSRRTRNEIHMQCVQCRIRTKSIRPTVDDPPLSQRPQRAHCRGSAARPAPPPRSVSRRGPLCATDGGAPPPTPSQQPPRSHSHGGARAATAWDFAQGRRHPAGPAAVPGTSSTGRAGGSA